MEGITTIFFDWGGVFCNPAEPFSHPKLLQALKLSPDEITEKVRPYYNQYYCGEIAYTEFWSRVLNFFGLKDLLTARELTTAYLNSYHIYPAMFEVLVKLRSKYKLAILSNLTKEMMEHIIKTHQLNQYFSTMIFSNIVGKMKPDPGMYLLALQRLEVEPRETIFIDDSQKNVAAAKALEISSIHFTSPEQCKTDFLKLGVII